MNRLPSSYVMEECDWLLGGGVSPELICKALDRSPDAILSSARRAGRPDIEASFAQAKRDLARRKVVA